MGSNEYLDKDFFKDLKKEISDYSEDITEGFPYFCLKIFWDKLSNENIKDSLSGLDTNDDSIDAFFVDDETKELNVIQCKSCISEKQIKSAKKEWFAYLNDVEKKLEDIKYIDNHKNEKVKEISEQYKNNRRAGYKLIKHLFHLGWVNKSIKDLYHEIIYYDLEAIKEQYLEYRSKMDRTEPDEIQITLSENHIIPNISNKRNTFISIITGDEIIKLREEYRYKLFDKNLRFGLGSNKINKQIIETAKNDPKNFYFFNNGITITSKKFKHQQTNDKLKINYPQIINGAQTVNALYETYKELKNKKSRETGSEEEGKNGAKKHLKDIKILFRIIDDSEKDGKKNSEFENNVIRFNNSQNSIKETDFYSNNPEQIELQRLFSELGYFYEIKRGDRKYLDSGKEEHNLLKKTKKHFKHWDKKIDIENLASIWMAYSNIPSTHLLQKAQIFGYASDKNYDIIFKKSENTEEKAKEMILAFNLFEIINSQANIYGSTKKRGQIISKISQFKKDDEGEMHKNILEIINSSIFLGDMVKKKSANIDDFTKHKQEILDVVKKYQFSSTGSYFTLGIFRLILEECKYRDKILEFTLYTEASFLKESIAKKWLKSILDKIILPIYKEFDKEIGSSVKTFYSRQDSWEKVVKKFKELPFDEDKEITEIFPLNMT